MYKDKKILCVITARGGSKRLPGKNIKLLNGKPLISYAIEAAKGSKYIDRVIVSTDDEAIASVAKEFGAEVPFMRPAELATDTAASIDVLKHAVAFVEKGGGQFDLIVLVQPTVPGVLSADIDASIKKLEESGANSCITVSEVVDPPDWMCKVDEAGEVTPYKQFSETDRSQDLDKFYRVNGAVYVNLRTTVMEKNMTIDNSNCVGVLMPRERSADIDTVVDFIVAEALMLYSRL